MVPEPSACAHVFSYNWQATPIPELPYERVCRGNVNSANAPCFWANFDAICRFDTAMGGQHDLGANNTLPGALTWSGAELYTSTRGGTMRKRLLGLSFIFCVLLGAGGLFAAETQKPPLTLDVFFNSVSFPAVQISPNGQDVVIATERERIGRRTDFARTCGYTGRAMAC